MWIGNPDWGTGRHQSGGWIFNLLQFMEVKQVYTMQSGLSGTARQNAADEMIRTPIPVFNCPTRRPAQLLLCDQSSGNPVTCYHIADNQNSLDHSSDKSTNFLVLGATTRPTEALKYMTPIRARHPVTATAMAWVIVLRHHKLWEAKLFHLHLNIQTSRASFFAAALSGP